MAIRSHSFLSDKQTSLGCLWMLVDFSRLVTRRAFRTPGVSNASR